MPIHEWTRVPAGTFHDFHTSWITHLKEALNTGLLPNGYYALSEQHAGRAIADAPPRVSRRMVASPETAYRDARRTLTIRHVSGHRVVALLEIVSPGNKDRPSSVEEFAEKAWTALRDGVHLLILDLFPPGPHDRGGMHGVIWRHYDAVDYAPPADKPLAGVSIAARALPEAYVEPLAVGDQLPAMPLFLHPDWYIDAPLEETYRSAYQGMPTYWRRAVE